ncbi:cytochrome P450 [Aspergillus fischeri NRRL 181]|uniref:Cytochrome P450 oxidoreductase, putative n=1 Tax=Neosartorya fischeri (strain ATCC 1020 / DSM 3700 / CBS 544.65 / FGSC A1164 / JCM 1740 / NRRL 181 / WB 181) TaxID=331117 RepID=A1CVH2_NEOFI|nr:Cytochrome P450 oxidoreductase, putative [Aspergillus fischeri NRRL 181]EAW25749.1 Cytochrome P450 oxidoreductase, putative [Aspergillus fischeri NRRL 181]
MLDRFVNDVNHAEAPMWLRVLLDKSLLLIFISCVGVYAITRVLVTFYRLYLHPLAAFKGPRAAAISRNWVYKVLTGPSLPETVFENLHTEYGVKAIRIGPNELHLTDVSLYKTIYNQTTPYLKEHGFYDGFLTPHTIFAETDPQLHKERRKMLNHMFSKMGVRKLEPVIQKKILTLGKKIKAIASSGPINVYDAYRCMAIDIMMRFAFGNESDAINETPGTFKATFLTAFDAASHTLADTQENPVKRFVAGKIPLSLVAKVDKNIRVIYKLQDTAYQGIRRYKKLTESPSHPVIFDNLKSLTDKAQAAQSIEILLIGSDTSAFTLSMGSFHILSSPECKEKLVATLNEHIPNPDAMPSLVELEKIDYLWAVVKEVLRMAISVHGRLPRVVPKEAPPLLVDGKVIPPGTVIGMSAYTMHTSIELWVRTSAHSVLNAGYPQMELGILTGSRSICVPSARAVAYAEVTMALAYFFRTFDMTLRTTKPELRGHFTLGFANGMMIDFKKSLRLYARNGLLLDLSLREFWGEVLSCQMMMFTTI